MNGFLFLATLAVSVGAVFGGVSSSYGAPPARQEYGAPAPQPEYGAPPSFSGGYDQGSSSGGYDQGSSSGQVHRHVYIHVAPDEPVDSQSRVIRVPGGQDKHVNIIFVKAPSASSSQQTEVILPEQDQQKTLVYVLVKKAENSNNVKIRGPAATKPPKPEVYFIRYKSEQQTGGESYGPPGYQAPPPSNAYGAP